MNPKSLASKLFLLHNLFRTQNFKIPFHFDINFFQDSNSGPSSCNEQLEMFSTQPQHSLNLNFNCSYVLYEKEFVCHPSNTNTNSRVPPGVSDELLLTTTNTTIRRTTTITFTTTTRSQKEQKQQNNLKIIRLLLWCWFYKKVNGIFHKGSGPAHRPPNPIHFMRKITYMP